VVMAHLRMPMGYTNSPAVFQEAMMTILADPIRKGDREVYIDDILIKSKSVKDHLEHVRAVLDLLLLAGVKANLRKCKFMRPEIEYLGLMINGTSIRIDPARLQGLRDMGMPRNLRTLRGFLSLCSYYRSFVRNLPECADPLWDLNVDGCQVHKQWRQEHTEAFDRTQAAHRPGRLPQF
jgi:hypothetical protein